jgi:dethiobiotin synthetase
LSAHFITGAGTDIGKTYVTTLLVRRLRAAGRGVVALKPVASGMPAADDPAFAATDTARLLDAAGLAATVAHIAACSPWRFAAPLSPDMAAAAEGCTLDFDRLLAWCRRRIDAAPADATVLIEGVGGIMSPVTATATNLDWIAALRCPALLVTGSYLGALTHTLTAVTVLKARAVPLTAVVLNETAGSTVGFDATLATLRRFLPQEWIVPLRHDADRLEIDLD